MIIYLREICDLHNTIPSSRRLYLCSIFSRQNKLDVDAKDRPSSGDLAQKRASTAMAATKRSSTMATNGAGSQRKPSVAITAMSHRPDVTAKTGKHPSTAGVGGRGAGASKRASPVAYREGRKNLLSSHRKASQQGVGPSKRISRAVVAAGS